MQAVSSTITTRPVAVAAARAPRTAAAPPRMTTVGAVAGRRDRASVGGSSLGFGARLGASAAARGSHLAVNAKKSGKKKKPEPEPVVEEDDEEDEEEDVEDEGFDQEDEEAGSEEAVVVEDDEDDEDAEARDASELLPSAVYEEEDEEEVEDASALSSAVGYVQDAVSNPAVRNLGVLGLSVLAGSFALSVYKVYMKYNSNRSKRKRQVNKNVVVVERLRDFFPDNRDSLTRGHIRGLQGKTGFKPAEIFRKYMRYKLNEEVFNNDFVADVLALKRACELDGDTMRDVLMETGERMVKKYGTLLRDVSDMGPAGAKRKVDGCSMFAKVMYLADLEEFIPHEQGAAVQQRLKEIFGATDEDYEKLRIDALGSEAADISVLEAMITKKEGETGAEGEGDQGAASS